MVKIDKRLFLGGYILNLNNILKTSNNHYSFHYDDPQCFIKLETVIFKFMIEMNKDLLRDIIYLCIGTDRATGDCLGPLVGTRLKTLSTYSHIYGTLKNPTHATNLSDTLIDINDNYNNPLIIAIDACLGSADRIGYINVKKGSLQPGTALKKVLPEVGDFHLSGVVNVGGFLEHMVLQNTRLYTVYAMADIIAKSLHLANYRYERYCRQENHNTHLISNN